MLPGKDGGATGAKGVCFHARLIGGPRRSFFKTATCFSRRSCCGEAGVVAGDKGGQGEVPSGGRVVCSSLDEGLGQRFFYLH
jgi:hypothetical protein